jgi:tetratricopeptide (TPR) repeat protein
LWWQLNADAELENLRTALAWAVSHDQGAQAVHFLCVVGVVPSALSRVMLRDAEAILALPSIQSIERYPLAVAAAASAALFHGALERSEQLCQQALDVADEPTDELLGLVLMTRGNAAYGMGDVSRAIELIGRAASCHRRDGDTFMLAFCLCAVSIFRTFSGDVEIAAAEGREALELARSTGNPGSISQALGALAVGLAPTEPEQSRSYIAESALSMVLMASAVLGDRDDALTQCARALRHGLSLVVAMCACLEVTADMLADVAPDVAVVLHGAIDALLPGFVQGEMNAALRHRANATILAQLDSARITELGAHGAWLQHEGASASE